MNVLLVIIRKTYVPVTPVLFIGASVKVNLLLNGTTFRADYQNVDPIGDPNREGIVSGDVGNLDWLAEDAEVEDLLALDVIDYMPATQIDIIIDHWIGKLRHGGTITIGGVDMREVAKALMGQRLDINQANALLFGEQNSPWQGRKLALTMQHMIDILKNRELEIMRKDTRAYHYYITARRP